MFTVRTFSPYKDYSSFLRWQANICVYIITMELHRRRYAVDFESVYLIFIDEFILLFMALVELLGQRVLLPCL
jgi:hypothetical protein